jgi:hypothetical protein
MPSAVLPHPPVTRGNGAAPLKLTEPRQAARIKGAPRSPLLARLTGLTSVATVAAAGLMVVGVLAVAGGSYDHQIVRDQLVPQKIFFPPAGSPALLPGIKQYAGQQLVNGDQAKAYANDFINVHLSKIAGGQTYAQVSAASLAAPTNAKLAAQKASLFQGETLRGLLLGAWGWAMIGTIATIAGVVLIGLGAVLFLLPLINWQVNLRGRVPTAAGV